MPAGSMESEFNFSCEQLIDLVVAQYFESSHFNGLPAYQLARTCQMTRDDLMACLEPLVARGVLSLNFGNYHPNPHIRALEDRPVSEQLESLKGATDDCFVIYPTPSLLEKRVDPRQYDGRPFSLRLALGAPQFDYACFDLATLDHYRRDPRYLFWTNDVQASLSVGDEAYISPDFPEKHKILIQSFGFAYAEDLSRCVAVFLTDLDGLTPEHQQIWAAFEKSGEYKLHPDFWRAALLGDWELNASLSEAFIEEIRTINAMCTAIGRPPLFRQVFSQAPAELAFLIRPTLAEFNNFVLLLDKLMSENINLKFFPSGISRDTEEPRPDGKIAVRPRGTIAMLEEWLNSFTMPDPDPKIKLIATIKKVRKLRQKPAHAIDPNTHDLSLFKKQRQLFDEAYCAIRTIRLMFQNHPKAREVAEKMDPRVRKGDIWSC